MFGPAINSIPRPRAARAAESISSDLPIPVIRSVGLVTPLGCDGPLWSSLLCGDFIRDHGRVALKTDGNQSRVSDLACRAAASAFGQLPDAELTSEDVGLIVGTSKGPVDQWLTAATPPLQHMSVAPYEIGGLEISGIASLATEIATTFGLTGPRLTICSACSSGLEALIRAALMIRSREAQRVLIVAVESSFHPLFLASFQRLGVLAPKDFGCRPFDKHRQGFLMSEAAAAVIVEAMEPGDINAGSTPKNAWHSDHPGVVIERFASGGDGSHLTGSDPQCRTLRHLLTHVIDGNQVDLIHAHGTGTLANDEAELAAIEACIADGELPPSVYSHKGALGHSLGAAGLVAVALNCLCHDCGLVPPNVQTRDPLPCDRVSISPSPVTRTVQRSIALAAGFGGGTAVVGLRTLQ